MGLLLLLLPLRRGRWRDGWSKDHYRTQPGRHLCAWPWAVDWFHSLGHGVDHQGEGAAWLSYRLLAPCILGLRFLATLPPERAQRGEA